MGPTSPPFKSITTYQAARELGVTIRTIQLWVDKGIISCWKTPGGHRRVNSVEVQNLVLLRAHGKTKKNMGEFRVLVIEDDPDICQLYDLKFRAWGLRLKVEFASDGLIGLVKFGEFKPQFTIVDMDIPLLDGTQIIKALHSTLSVDASRLCVVTGLSEELLGKRGALPDQVALLSKPIDFELLRKKLEAVANEVQ